MPGHSQGGLRPDVEREALLEHLSTCTWPSHLHRHRLESSYARHANPYGRFQRPRLLRYTKRRNPYASKGAAEKEEGEREQARRQRLAPFSRGEMDSLQLSRFDLAASKEKKQKGRRSDLARPQQERPRK